MNANDNHPLSNDTYNWENGLKHCKVCQRPLEDQKHTYCSVECYAADTNEKVPLSYLLEDAY